MRIKISLIAILLLCLCNNVQAQAFKQPHKGYKGEAGVALGAAVADQGALPVVDLFTTHGYQFNSRFFMGGGFKTLNSEYISLYAELRGNLRRPSEHRPSYPYLGFKVGYSASTWIGEKFGDDKGVFFEPRFGWSFYSRAGNVRYNVFGSVELFSYSLIPKIGVAFEF